MKIVVKATMLRLEKALQGVVSTAQIEDCDQADLDLAERIYQESARLVNKVKLNLKNEESEG